MSQRKPSLSSLLWIFMCAAGPGAAGCGGGFMRLPESALLGLPTDGRRFVFDSENTVVVALDNVDVAREGLRDSAANVERARQSLKAARSQQGPRGSDLGLQAAQARLDAALAEQKLAEQQVDLARLKVKKARADLELDKAHLIVTYDLVAVRGFSVQPFAAQAESAARAVQAAQQKAESLSHKLQEQQDRMQKARQDYVAKTGDFDSGVWLD